MTTLKPSSTFPSLLQLPTHRQQGLGLVELMVGIAIGLLVVATSLGVIVLSRTMTGTVSDVSTLQQQASYAFRVIGQQIRQAGSRTLKPAADPTEYGEFDSDTGLGAYVPVQGKSAPGNAEYALEIVYQNSEEKSYPLVNGTAPLLPPLRNCLGESISPSSSAVISSRLKLVGDALVCAGSSTPETIITGVADFQVRYLRSAHTSATPSFTYVAAENLANKQDWLQIYAVEICLELVGTQMVDTAGASYTRCDKTEAPRGNKLRMVQRSTYFINNRVWTTSY